MIETTPGLVSIVVPAFNASDTLQDCLESARVQSYSNIEVIVIDDGSIDSSFDIASSFASRDSRFHALQQENAGVGAARNNALDHCRGEWVSFLDADDLLTSTCIDDLLAATDPNTDMVIGSIQRFRTVFNMRCDAGTVRMGNKSYFDGKCEPLSALDGPLSLVSSKLFRKSVISNSEISFGSVPYSEDHRFGLAFAAAGSGIVKTIDKIVYLYRCGGAASAVRFYPTMDRISLSMLSYYREVCASSPRFYMDEAFCSDAPVRWLDGVLMHFNTCMCRNQVYAKCLEAIEEFSSVEEPYGFSVNAPAYYDEWLKSRRIKIIAKRALRSMRLKSLKG